MIKKENELSQSETHKPNKKAGAIFIVTALVIGALCLVFYWYVTGLARGFSSH